MVDENGKETSQTLAIKQREYAIQRVNGVKQSTVTPPRDPKLQARINREAEEIAASRASSVEEPLFDSGFVRPAEGKITGVYGSQRVYNGTPKQPHFGIDYAAPAGTPAYAPADGIVRLAQKDNFFSGDTVIIDHGYNLNSAFLHMQKLHVKVGQRVKQGDLIGDIGAGGRATGSHLDWRMNWFDQRIDPALVVDRFKKD
jgi:murein DD-endopeptidase MepM/ murein hydrolase activator NlpD